MLIAAPPVAWAAWYVIERRSIRWSRQVGHLEPLSLFGTGSGFHFSARKQGDDR
jgi:hypothetical protein